MSTTGTVPPLTDKGAYVRDMFGRIAPRYDLTNRIMTAGMDERWRRRAIALLHAPAHGRIVDLCCGTGDIVFALVRSDPTLAVTGVDFCAPMLDAARRRARKRKARHAQFVEADVMALPCAEATVDGATMGFSLRNVVDVGATLREIRRVLKPGARFVNLDVSKAPNAAWKACFDLYFYHIVPLIGAVIGGSKGAYRYLPQSLTRHPDAQELARRFAGAGFKSAGCVPLMGGAVAIHYGEA